MKEAKYRIEIKPFIQEGSATRCIKLAQSKGIDAHRLIVEYPNKSYSYGISTGDLTLSEAKETAKTLKELGYDPVVYTAARLNDEWQSGE